MVIHSVTPVQMLMEQPAAEQLQTRPVRGGVVEGRQTERGFEMTRLISTDPSLYLGKQYTPGSIIG